MTSYIYLFTETNGKSNIVWKNKLSKKLGLIEMQHLYFLGNCRVAKMKYIIHYQCNILRDDNNSSFILIIHLVNGKYFMTVL